MGKQTVIVILSMRGKRCKEKEKEKAEWKSKVCEVAQIFEKRLGEKSKSILWKKRREEWMMVNERYKTKQWIVENTISC